MFIDVDHDGNERENAANQFAGNILIRLHKAPVKDVNERSIPTEDIGKDATHSFYAKIIDEFNRLGPRLWDIVEPTTRLDRCT